MKKILLLGLVALMVSCVKKDPPEPVGEAKVRFVNALKGSNNQDMFIRGQKVPNSLPLIYGQNSPYFTTTSGDIAFAFADQGATDGAANAGVAGKLAIGDNVTVFYFHTLPSKDNKIAAGFVWDDNNKVAGKAKVRFVHLNYHLNNFISFLKENGDSKAAIDAGVAFSDASKYYELDPGTKIYARAVDVPEDLLINVNLEAGKNYTIWIDGDSEKELVSHVIIQ